MKSNMEKVRLQDKPVEMDRARLVIAEMEILVKFISAFMQMASDLASATDPDAKKSIEQKLPFGNSTFTISYPMDPKNQDSDKKSVAYQLRITQKQLGQGKPTDYQGLDKKTGQIVLSDVSIDRTFENISFVWKPPHNAGTEKEDVEVRVTFVRDKEPE